MKKISFIVVALTMITSVASAQVNVKTEKGDLNLRLFGRTNFDAGSYIKTDDSAKSENGVMFNDTRLGVQANYGKWSTKIEICYTDKQIQFRDVYIGYDFNDSKSIQIGNIFMPYGAQCLGTQIKFVEDASADKTFCPSRKMGMAYFYNTDPLKLTAGIFSNGDINTKALNQGLALSAKAIWRPIINPTTVLHFGVAPMYVAKTAEPVTLTSVFPTTLETFKLLATEKAVFDNQSKYEAELLFIHKRFYAEAHYLGTKINYSDNTDLSASAFYAQAAFLIIGSQENYNKKTGLASLASAENLEILARVSHSDFDTFGESTDYTLGLNYYFTKYLNLRLNYIHAAVKDADSYDMIQARMQFYF